MPKEWSQDQIHGFQKHFDGVLAGNSALLRRVHFMPGDFKYQETKAPPLKDAYDEFIARIICFVFSVSPEPFVGQVNRSTAESSQARATAEGLAPLQRFVREMMNRVICKDMNCPDLEFVWQDTREQHPKEAAQIDVAYVGAGIVTPDEVRARMGLGALPKAKSVPVNKYNHNHDEQGRFATAQASAGSGTSLAGSDEDDDDDDDTDDLTGDELESDELFGDGGGDDASGMTSGEMAEYMRERVDKPSRLPAGTQVAAGGMNPEALAVFIAEAMREQSNEGADAELGAKTQAVGAVAEGQVNAGEVQPKAVSLPKPDGIPDNWIEKPADNPEGRIFTNPDNANDVVRIMPANPDSKFASQRVPYVIDQNGSFRDVNGNPINSDNPGKTSEAHIPLSYFKFKR